MVMKDLQFSLNELALTEGVWVETSMITIAFEKHHSTCNREHELEEFGVD